MSRYLLALLILLLCPTLKAEETSERVYLVGAVRPVGLNISPSESSHELVDPGGKLLARLSGREHQVDLASVEGQTVGLNGYWRSDIVAGGCLFEVSFVLIHIPYIDG